MIHGVFYKLRRYAQAGEVGGAGVSSYIMPQVPLPYSVHPDQGPPCTLKHQKTALHLPSLLGFGQLRMAQWADAVRWLGVIQDLVVTATTT